MYASITVKPHTYTQLPLDNPNESECGRYLQGLEREEMSSCNAYALELGDIREREIFAHAEV